METVRQVGIYLGKTIAFRIYMFFRRWYAGGFLMLYGMWLGLVRASERRLAIRINARFLFQPLYQERNIVGYVMGFLYHFFKIFLGGVWYGITACIIAFLYLLWAAVPIALIYKIIKGS
jgi:hypothetical protein